MTDADSNPYAVPEGELSEASPRPSNWRYVFVALCFLFGILHLGLGSLFLSDITRRILKENQYPPLEVVVGFCSVFFGSGAAWMIAVACFWKRKYRWGAIAVAIALFIPLVVINLAEL